MLETLESTELGKLPYCRLLELFLGSSRTSDLRSEYRATLECPGLLQLPRWEGAWAKNCLKLLERCHLEDVK